MVAQTPVVKASRWLAKKAEASPSEVLELKSAYLDAREKVARMNLFAPDFKKFEKVKKILDRHHGIVP